MLWYLMGLTDPSGPPYLFWSGIAGHMDMAVFLLVYRKLNCHEPRCPRLGHHPYEHYQYCKKHHPVVKNKV